MARNKKNEKSELVQALEDTSKTEETKNPEVSTEKSVFPAKCFINAYNFLHLKSDVAEAFGVVKGKKTPVSIELVEGKLIISKVA